MSIIALVTIKDDETGRIYAENMYLSPQLIHETTFAYQYDFNFMYAIADDKKIRAALSDKPASGFEWVEVKTRPATPEEVEEFPEIEFAFDCPLPDDGERVLVTTGYGEIEIDTFFRDSYGCYFENNDTNIKAWAHLPQGFKSLVGR